MKQDNATITFDYADHVVTITLNRPDARNAVNLEMCHALLDAFQRVADHVTRAVIVRSHGPVFCAGADLKERKGKDEAWVIARREAAFRAYASIQACPVPVVCAVQGPLVGSGGEIAMACDFVVAADTATFTFPEPQWGTVGATQRLQRVIGISRAKELLFTGRKMPAHEAYQLGLIARMVSADDLDNKVAAVIAKIVAAPPMANQLTKWSLDEGAKIDLAAGIEIELRAVREVLAKSNWRDEIARFKVEIGND